MAPRNLRKTGATIAKVSVTFLGFALSINQNQPITLQDISTAVVKEARGLLPQQLTPLQDQNQKPEE